MATRFMSRPKAAPPTDPAEALDLARLVPDLVELQAQADAIQPRRSEEAERAAEIERAIVPAEAVLADLDIALPRDEKAIAQARKALERLTQDLADSRRREAAYTRALKEI